MAVSVKEAWPMCSSVQIMEVCMSVPMEEVWPLCQSVIVKEVWPSLDVSYSTKNNMTLPVPGCPSVPGGVASLPVTYSK